MGFCNLKTVVEPITEDFERYILGSIIDELNSLFPLSLATDFVCDRFLDEDVFTETTNPTALVLVGASHLRNMARLFDASEWQIYDLTTPGRRISDQNVKKKVAEIANLSEEIELEKATIVLQLYDNSVFLVGGAGGTKSLPTRDPEGRYHINGELLVTDKAGIKELTSMLVPLIRSLCGAKKIFLAPLSRYWVDPCCGDPAHLTNYRSADFLPRLGAATSVLKEYIRDSLYTRHTSNFRVLCPNRILGIAQRRAELPIEDARELAAMWGRDPVHPSCAAYQTIAEGIGKDALNPDAKYTNPPRSVKSQAGAKKPRLDLSLERDSWVRGCTAALPRKDSTYELAGGSQQARGKWPRGRAWFRGAYPRGGRSRGRGRGRGN
jgi:hypothetical protein